MASSPPVETLQLFEAYREMGDATAREQLVVKHVPLVRSLCRRFHSSAEQREDLFQIGMIGLLNAIEKFDPNYGTSFVSLAIPKVLGAISNHLRDHGNLLKVPRPLVEHRMTVNKVSGALACRLGHWPTVAELAEACGLSEGDVCEALTFGQTGEPRSLDEEMEYEDTDRRVTLYEQVSCKDDEFGPLIDRLTLATAQDYLPPRERLILELRFYKDMSQRQIAGRIGISQMHVSRLERKALRILRGVLKRSSAPPGSTAEDSSSPDSETAEIVPK